MPKKSRARHGPPPQRRPGHRLLDLLFWLAVAVLVAAVLCWLFSPRSPGADELAARAVRSCQAPHPTLSTQRECQAALDQIRRLPPRAAERLASLPTWTEFLATWRPPPPRLQ